MVVAEPGPGHGYVLLGIDEAWTQCQLSQRVTLSTRDGAQITMGLSGKQRFCSDDDISPSQ